MKKVLISLFAVAAMVSCSNDELVELNQQAIAFGDAFVDNATRADYSEAANKVKSFKVYGTATGSGNTVQIFNGVTISRPTDVVDGSDTAWKQMDGTPQFWLPSVEYNFVAIVDGASTTETLPETIPFTVADGANNKDLLYAETTITTDEDAVPEDGVTTKGLVPFTFGHLLSKVQFTVANAIQNYTIQVTGIEVTGVAAEGTYTVLTDKWAQNGSTKLTFGTTGDIVSGANAVASETRQILPVQQTLGITISYDIYFGTTKISSATKTGNITHAFAKNTVYNIGATISGNQIKFTVTGCAGFTAGSDINM